MSVEQAWAAMLPLTKLGERLGDLNLEIDVPEGIDLLEIGPGRIDLQHLFYWHICKTYYSPDMSLQEMNHVNLDWHLPANAHRQTREQARGWCHKADLSIEYEYVQESGITIMTRKC